MSTSSISTTEKNYEYDAQLLAHFLELHSEFTKHHSARVSRLALDLGKQCDFNEEQLNNLEYAALLHDIGKVGVSAKILNKESGLTVEEYEEIKKHPIIGHRILSRIKGLENASNIVLQHHERIDGKGYPFGLTGDQIYTEAKIISIADAFDSMVHARPYKKNPMTIDQAIEVLINNKGTQFDAELVDKFISIIKEEPLHKFSSR